MKNSIKAKYESTRLLFKAEVIEPLSKDEKFCVSTPDGDYVMGKADFYRVFPNVVRSRSYSERGIYHYPRTPGKADPFRRA